MAEPRGVDPQGTPAQGASAHRAVRWAWAAVAVVAAVALVLRLADGDVGRLDWLNGAGLLLLAVASIIGPRRRAPYLVLLGVSLVFIVGGLVVLLRGPGA